MTPDRLAFDLQRTLNELEHERERTQKLLGELEHQNRELDRLRGTVHRESNSRLLAEEALDETRDRLQLAVDAAGLALWDWQLPATQVFLTARWGELLGDIAAAVGLSREQTATRLAGTEGLLEVLAEDARAREIGIQGVPTFIFEGKYVLSGAHPPEVMFQMFDLIANDGPDDAGTAPV